MWAGFNKNQMVWYTGPYETFADDSYVSHGDCGQVVGPASGQLTGQGVKVKFGQNADSVDLHWSCLEDTKGFSMGTKVWWGGPSQSDKKEGWKLTAGDCGFVSGRAVEGCMAGEDPKFRVRVKFPQNSNYVPCDMSALLFTNQMPNGFTLGQQVFFIGNDYTCDNGAVWKNGTCCQLLRPARMSESSTEFDGFYLHFPGVAGKNKVVFSQIIHSNKESMQGYTLGQTVWYTGKFHQYDGGTAEKGQQGIVAGPVKSDASSIRIQFPHNKRQVRLPYADITSVKPKPASARPRSASAKGRKRK